MRARLGWKVPFRSVYCNTFVEWARQTFWCHVVIRIFPGAIDLHSDALVHFYKKEPTMFFDQYETLIDEAVAKQKAYDKT